MRITYLLEDSTRIWGGVKAVFAAANALHDRGHDVTVVSRSPAPQWFDLRCAFRESAQFEPADIPHSDVVVATFWTTVAPALHAQRGPVVHYCQGYEGDNPEFAAVRPHIEQVYRLEQTHLVTISPHLESLLQRKFNRQATRVTYAIEHTGMDLRPGPAATPNKPVRVGIVGPYEIAWKDIPTGIEACELAHRAGLDLELVRVSNTGRHPDERDLGFPVEWHDRVPPAQMGELYRSFDVFVGTSRGDEEGFFLPAIEAMACGVPAVLTDIPCFRGYGDGQYALFVEPQDPAQMAEAIVLAAGHAELRGELRATGLATADRYTIDNHVTELEAAFAKVAAHSGAPSQPTRRPTANSNTTSNTASSTASSRFTTPSLVAPPRSPAPSAPRTATPETENTPLTATTLESWLDTVRTTAAKAQDLSTFDRVANTLATTLAAEVEHQRGLLEYAAGQYAAAARSFARALEGSNQPAEVLNDLGVACHTLGEEEAARAHFEHALRIQPDHPDASSNLASLPARIA